MFMLVAFISCEDCCDSEEDREYPKNRPKKDTTRVSAFREGGRRGSVVGAIRSQFIEEPPTIAARLSISVGKENVISLSFKG